MHNKEAVSLTNIVFTGARALVLHCNDAALPLHPRDEGAAARGTSGGVRARPKRGVTTRTAAAPDDTHAARGHTGRHHRQSESPSSHSLFFSLGFEI